MCGIAGIITKNAGSYQKEIEHMISSLRHRGPDGDGKKYFQNCVLGHTRLSIIDQDGGHQPMTSTTSPKTIVFNGEIYGYKNIRNSLSGYTFNTQSDTEVILALYDLYREGCLEKLPGMFSFAIWEDDRQTLFAARDRFGEKPFYYAWGKNGEFIFASEIKAILATGLVAPVLDNDSLKHYLQYLYVHPTKTIYSNIFTLPPAHYLKYVDGEVTVKKYWCMPQTCDTVDPATAVKQFQKLFENSIQKQLVADVPVGAFLSGGLDSSTVVGVASKYKTHLKTFSFGFGETINELPYAQEIADKFVTEHQILKAEHYDIAELILEMAKVYDEPFADSSNIPTYLISKLASQHLKVILTGDGADELLGGYDYWYRSALLINKTNIRYPLTKKIIRKVMDLHQNNYCLKSIISSKIWSIIPAYLRYDNVIQAQEEIRKYFSDEEIFELIINPESFSFEKQKKTYSFKEEQSANDALRVDLENYMPGDILVKIDRASMAHGLELRAPFLDLELAALCISLPVSFKISENKTKILLRNAYEKMWTPSIRTRRKQGFGAPVHEWLQLKSVKRLKKKYLFNEQMKIFKIFSFKRIQTYLSRDDYKTWIFLVLSIWMEKNEFLQPAEVK